jgi:WD40 repeat protein
MVDAPVYDAFASHATDPDGELVRAVEARIEAFYRQPGIPAQYRHQLQVCVDGRDFIFPKKRGNTAEIIEEVVRAYQKRSRSLLVFAGPTSRDHHWVNEEISWWRKDRPDGPIYFALTHGVDPTDQSAIMPPALARVGGPDNVIFFDLRGFYRGFRPIVRLRDFFRKREANQIRVAAHSWKKVRPFGEEIAKLAAQLVSDALGNSIAVADLMLAYEAAERTQRRIRWAIRAVVGLIVVGLISVTGYAGYTAYVEHNTSIRNSWIQQAEALSNAPGPQLVDALAFAASAVDYGDNVDPNAIGVLYTILPKLVPIKKTIRPSQLLNASEQTQTALLFGHDRWLAFGGREGKLHVTNTENETQTAVLSLNCGRINSILEVPGRRELIVGSDKGVRLVEFDQTGGKLSLKQLAVVLEKERIRGLAFSSELGLFAGSLDGKIWKVMFASTDAPSPGLPKADQILEMMDPRYEDVPSSVFGLALRGNDLTVAGIDGVLTKYDVSATPKQLAQIVHPASIFSLDVSQAGDAVAVADQEGNVTIYDGNLSHPRTASIKPAEPASIAQEVNGDWFAAAPDQASAVGIGFDYSGTVLAVTGHDHTVKFLLAKDLRLIGSVVQGAATRGVVFARDSPVAYTFGDDGMINVVQPLLQKDAVRIGKVAGLVVSDHADRVGYWVRGAKEQATEYVLDLAQDPPGEIVGQFPANDTSTAMSFGENAFLLRSLSTHVSGIPFLASSNLGCISSGLHHPNEADNSQTVYRMLPGTKADEILTLASADGNKTSILRLWSARDCKASFTQNYSGAAEQAATAAGVIGFVEHNREIHIVDVANGNTPADIKFNHDIATFALAPNGSEVLVQLSGSDRCSCKPGTQNVSSKNQCVARSSTYYCEPLVQQSKLPSATSLFFSKSGNFLVLTYGSIVALANRDQNWDPTQVAPQQISPIDPPFDFSLDESLFAIPAGDTGIRVINTETKKVVAILPTPSRVKQIKFMKDGTNRLASIDSGVLRIWDFNKEALLKEACARWPTTMDVGENSAIQSPMTRSEICDRSVRLPSH